MYENQGMERRRYKYFLTMFKTDVRKYFIHEEKILFLVAHVLFMGYQNASRFVSIKVSVFHL